MGVLNHFMVQKNAFYAPYNIVGGQWLPSFPPLTETRYIPFSVASLVLVIQVLHFTTVKIKSFFISSDASIKDAEESNASAPAVRSEESLTIEEKLKAWVAGFGGIEIFVFMVARLFGCVSLFIFTANATPNCQAKHLTGREEWKDYLLQCPESLMAVTYGYSVALGIISLGSKTWRTSTSRYNILVLLSALVVYVYRNLWPLATFDKQPADLAEGKLLWVKLVILFTTGAVIPVFMSQPYVPVDPKNPMAVVNPEQTSSLFSYLTFTYMDDIILKGYRTDHLPVSELPPLPDYDQIVHLKSRGTKYLDTHAGAKPRHLFFGLLRTFRKELILMTISMILNALASFAAPIGINRILNYLETGGKGATIRPGFWILWLFIGPIAGSLVYNWYFFIAQATTIRVEALLTDLLFEHTLRVRLKAETSEKKAESGVETPKSGATTPKASGSSTPTGEGSSIAAHSQASTAVMSEGHTSTASEASTLVPPTNNSSDSNGKGKAKAKAEPPKEEKKSETNNFAGKLNNLVTSDLNAISQARDWLMLIFSIPLIITLSMVFLYQFLGWSCFVFLFTTLAFMGIPGYVSTLIAKTQKEKMKATDARVQTVTETVNILRMVKLFGWESQMDKRIEEKREEELRLLRKQKILSITNGLMGYFIPTFTMVLTYTTYVVVMKGSLTPSKIFSTMVVFESVRLGFQRIIWQANMIIQGKVSLDRVGEFLHKTELLDAYTSPNPQGQNIIVAPIVEAENPEIGFRNATFMWSREAAEETDDSSKRRFTLRVDGELLFKRGRVNLIVGPTGSGKTSVLMALLGEMHFISTDPDSWYNMPRGSGVAYAAQESWVLNDTLRNNITFGSPYDEERYNRVIKQCALERDLGLFEAGDQTEVGEKGLTLSGGQKARVTLARAIYSTADILLLDDIFAALDVHTAAWIIDNCLKGGLVQGRTVLLITHNVALASPIADFIISIGLDGKIVTRGVDLTAALSDDPALAVEVEKDKEAQEISKQNLKEPALPTNGKLVLAEEVAQGRVTMRSMKLMLNSLGGGHPFMFYLIFTGSFALTEAAMTFQVWFLGYWGSQYENRLPEDVPVKFYVFSYTTIFVGIIVLYTFAWIFYIYGNIRAARKINKLLIDSILRSTLRWLDETPTGRIITRCTQDIRAVDAVIPQYMLMVQDCLNVMIIKLAAIILFTPVFIFPGIAFALLGVFLGNVYQKAQLSVKRESSNAKAPVLSHFSAAVQGLVSIRAYGAEKSFTGQAFEKLNLYTHLSRTSLNLNRWIAVRIDTLGALFSAALACYLVYGPRSASSTAGFTLNMSVEFTMSILWLVRIYNEFEVQANSLERIQGYLDIDHEPKATEAGKPPAYWPASGDLRVENLSARYSKSGPKVLHEVSFHLKSGERVGVVGRTGSGKSSLTLALLRGIFTEGAVHYDGVATDTLNLDALRSNITIIPQIPELLSGTLRQNLDPLQVEDDATLNDALRSAGLFTLQEEAGEARLTLDTSIAGGGGNLSVGQKQILALARAMIRGSKILILDEATSAIDYKTDAIIQTTLREQLPKNVTVITVAHRLQTVMDSDKILVLDEGKIVEFDEPKELLKRETGALRSLVDGSGDKSLLYELASAKP
ncbi:multidrug resistance-associated ABC transporter [Crepidotus variabilis]|uniref:Multidrug resistance-associated ABC transporter n=1 Tax=Crepidotus variabilis TaxID=179855 RepID=A0A9P6JMP2_9AGAR|nr:multidrug resistance-associated ABC transporter [Crepidotus variabilis]